MSREVSKANYVSLDLFRCRRRHYCAHHNTTVTWKLFQSSVNGLHLRYGKRKLLHLDLHRIIGFVQTNCSMHPQELVIILQRTMFTGPLEQHTSPYCSAI